MNQNEIKFKTHNIRHILVETPKTDIIMVIIFQRKKKNIKIMGAEMNLCQK